METSKRIRADKAAKKSANTPETVPFSFTIQGIWQPTDPNAVRSEMRLFSSCVRWMFNRLQEIPKGESDPNLPVADKPLNRIKREAQQIFHLNSRYVADAMMEAKVIIESQKELLPIQIHNLEKRIENLDKAEKKALRILKKPDSVETAERWERKLQSIRYRKQKAVARKKELQNHLQNGTIPKVVFGGRRLLKRLTQSHGNRHQQLRRTWRLARQGTLDSRGDVTKGGNPNIRIISNEGIRFDLQAAMSHQTESKGADILGRPIMSDAPRIGGVLWIPDKFRLLLMDALLSSRPYSVRIMEEIRPRDAVFPAADAEGTVFRVHITIDRQSELPEARPDLSRGVLSMDENPHGIAIANVGPQGNLEPFPEGFTLPEIAGSRKFAGDIQAGLDPRGTIWLHVPEFRTARGFRRTYLAGVAAKFVCEVARSLSKPLVLEDLNFGQTLEKGQRPNFNRLASGFNHGKVIRMIERRARREAVAVIQVDPAFTSVIGGFKYQESLGLSVHQAAALTIGRRALRKRERIGAGALQRIQKLREDIQSALNRLPELVPGEGTRGAVGGQLKRLLGLLADERILIHNGFLTDWADRKRTGIWGSISAAQKLLASLNLR
jgi:IS605 OrfB family transposase